MSGSEVPRTSEQLRALEPASFDARAHRRRLRIPLLTTCAALLVLGTAAATIAWLRPPRPRCAEVAKRGDDTTTATVCRLEYERDRTPRAGALLANALRRKSPGEAAQLARALLATPAQADALYVLGKIAGAQDRHDDADAALTAAVELHRRALEWPAVAKDLLALADAAAARKRFAAALGLLDECAAAALHAGDRGLESFCHSGSARVYSRLGYRGGVQEELALARQLAARPVDLLWIHLAEGDEHQKIGDHAQAVVAFERGLALARSLNQPRAERTAHMNLAYSLVRAGHDAEAAEHLRRATLGEDPSRDPSDRWIIEAMLKRRRGELSNAVRDAERAVQLAEQEAEAERDAAAGDALTSEELAEAETLRAQLALGQGDLDGAEKWARRAIGHVELLRARQPLLQLRSWVVERHRAPHEVLFASLARAGRAEAALAAFDAWAATSSLDAVAASSPFDEGTPPVGALAPAPTAPAAGASSPAQRSAQVERLTALLHNPPPRRPGTRSGDVELTGAPVLALVVAQDELWRLESIGGAVSLHRLGLLSALRPQLDQLVSTPSDLALAASLGELLLTPALAAATSEALHVVLDSPLAYLPVAALRWRGRTLGALRPLVRALRPAHLTCWSRPTTPRRAAVLADSRGDLPGARGEAEEVARRLGGGAALSIGDAASRHNLNLALGTDFLHLATHAEIDELGGKLVLADGPFSALELAGSPRAPSQVVLATCGSGISLPGSYSLALGFLSAGADQVLATLRRVNDDATARITSQLYHTGISDLVSELWRLQATMPEAQEDLSSFVVFGDVPCSSRSTKPRKPK